MKIKQLLLVGCLTTPMLSIAQNIHTPALKHVTIFSKGAQVNREASVPVKAGEQIISFTGISPFTDANSLQVNASENITILGVNHHFAFPDSAAISNASRTAERELKQAQKRVGELIMQRKVLEEQLELVKKNCSISNRTVATPLENIKQLNHYYYDEVMAINKKLSDLDEEDRKANEICNQIRNRRDSVVGLRPKRMMVVDVKIDAKNATQAKFSFKYYTGGASWFPSYEIRSNSINDPLQLTYKASISQQTNEVWKQANVTLSSANPNRSNVLPELKTYWLDYGKRAPSYDFSKIGNGKVSGAIYDEQGEPLIGATVMVDGTSIGTTTDLDGKYSITMPANRHNITVSYIGMKTQTRRANGQYLDFNLENDNQTLNDVVVVGYGVQKKHLERMPGVEVTSAKAAKPKAVRINNSNDLETTSSEAKFGYDFEIQHPLTIASGNKPTVSSIGTYSIPSTYSYRSVPKIDKSAFLVADATGWDNLNLIEGEASVFYDNSFVGKTVVSPDMESDTLHLSLGRDQGIRIDRKLVKSNTVHKFLANNQEQTMEWEITVRNTRKESVDIQVDDQVPVSQNGEIKVNILELSEGKLDKETGIVKWNIHLAPQETKKFKLSYQIKYGKNRRLDIE